ncbi:MAG: Rrf2 family transcriptional regulator [Trichococcus sp.]|uniref:Rrf2 family transcriptional regulator n=1 Tax=Trichococcus sp. TaxID=1985464 RepID=UPI003C3CC012
MDTKFSVAIHILVMITESERSLSSQALAISVGTNASYIRKVIGLLKKAELISSQQGKGGYKLTKAPNQISLLDIYYATQEINRVNLFQMHQNPNETCPVGQHIEGALTSIFSEVEIHLANEMSSQTLEDVISNLYKQAKIAR